MSIGDTFITLMTIFGALMAAGVLSIFGYVVYLKVAK